jgi:hypothetical protein
MRAFQLYKERFLKLSPEDQQYAIQFLLGMLDMEAEGFTQSTPDQPHAKWAVDQWERAITRTEALPKS